MTPQPMIDSFSLVLAVPCAQHGAQPGDSCFTMPAPGVRTVCEQRIRRAGFRPGSRVVVGAPAPSTAPRTPVAEAEPVSSTAPRSTEADPRRRHANRHPLANHPSRK